MILKTVSVLMLAAISVVWASMAMAEDSPPVATDSTTTLTQPTVTTVSTSDVPPPTPPSDPPNWPDPSDQVQALLLKQVKVQIGRYHQLISQRQQRMGLRVTPIGNITSLTSLDQANQLLMKLKVQSHLLHVKYKKWMLERIQKYSHDVDYMRRVMGLRSGRFIQSSGNVELRFVEAKRIWKAVRHQFQNPPHLNQFLCIHSYEGSWTDAGAPYYGGIQFGAGEWRQYGQPYTGKAYANQATPLEQIWAGEHYWRVRRFYPWPHTARDCGLI